MGLFRINIFVVSRSFKKPFCATKQEPWWALCRTTLLFRKAWHWTRIHATFYAWFQSCFSLQLLFFIRVLHTFESSHHRFAEIRKPEPELRRWKFWVLSNRHVRDSPGSFSVQEPLLWRCHRHNTLRSRPMHCSLTHSASGGLYTWRCFRLNLPSTHATGHGSDSHMTHLLASCS